MSLFQHRLKLYYKRDRDQVDLSILISENYVQTFYFERSEFEQILKQSLEPDGYSRPGLFVFCKKTFLRWSFDGDGMTHQIRVERDKWLELIKVYDHHMSTSKEAIVSCVVT